MHAKRGHLPQEQRPVIMDVLPADIAPRLDKLPKTVNKKLIKSIPTPLRRWWLPVLGIVIVVSVAAVVWRPWQANGATLPSGIAKQVDGFVPYYFQTMPLGMKVVEKTLSYDDGVLFFQVQNDKGNSIVVAEQALPQAFTKNAAPQGESIDSAAGSAFIADRDGRMVGTLLTDKKPRALISLNTSGTPDREMMRRVLQNLKPVQ